MAANIRLKRVGAKKEASYRIVVTDARQGTSGMSIERLGIYNPRTEPALIRLDAARTLYWLREGASPSDTVRSLLRKTGVWKQFHDGVTPEAIEDPVVVVGPPPGQQGTSRRPLPLDKAPKVSAAAAVAKEAMPEPEAAAEPEVAEEAATAEGSAEPAVEEEAAAAEEPAEPAAEPEAAAEEAVEASAEAVEEAEEAAAEAADEAVDESAEEAEAEVEEVVASAEDTAEEAADEAADKE